jgi:hypothetical protein
MSPAALIGGVTALGHTKLSTLLVLVDLHQITAELENVELLGLVLGIA